MKTLTAKQVDRLINDEFNRRCSGIEIDIMDIGKIFDVGREAYRYARHLDPDATASYVGERVSDFVQRIRKN